MSGPFANFSLLHKTLVVKETEMTEAQTAEVGPEVQIAEITDPIVHQVTTEEIGGIQVTFSRQGRLHWLLSFPRKTTLLPQFLSYPSFISLFWYAVFCIFHHDFDIHKMMNILHLTQSETNSHNKTQMNICYTRYS